MPTPRATTATAATAATAATPTAPRKAKPAAGRARAHNHAKISFAAVAPISERAFQDVIVEYARLNGWHVYAVPDSRRATEAGWPDLALTHERMGRFLLREIKTERGRVRVEQQAYHRALAAAGVDVAVWRPSQWGEIEATLYWRREASQNQKRQRGA